ncbi:MAG: S-layer homology domain-containing protein [Chloroflexi bacterium]|nr:S-layer homology domain-containing protein [Chloroflexota bacterium]
MRKILLLIAMLTIILMSAGVVWASPPVPLSHSGQWADEAVKALTDAGILEGYPEGSLQGERGMSRWEMAMILARFLNKMEKTHQLLLSKEELEEVMAIANNIKVELSAFGVRVDELEKQVPPLQKRVDELDKIHFYGMLDSIGVSQGFNGAVNIGLYNNLATDWFTGRRMADGAGVTALAILGVEADLDESLKGGMELAGYTGQGEPTIDQYWGVTPPYLSNPFTALGSTDPTNPSGSDNEPWTRMTLNRFWLQNDKTKDVLIAGAYNPVYIDDFVCVGPRNPNINKPDYLPLFGFNYSGEKKWKGKGPYKYEIFYSMLPQRAYQPASGATTYMEHYNTWNAGGNLTYEFASGSFSVNFMRVANETSPGISTIGSVALPTVMTGWADARAATVTIHTTVGPQQQNNIGARLTVDLKNGFTATARYASTSYNPDIDKWLYDTVVSGGMFSFDITGKIKRTDIALQYLSVDPTYDPFMLHYPLNTNIPVFLPYSTYYSDYYQLHDNIRYPNNRQGYRINLAHPVKTRGRISLTYESFLQVKSSAQSEITKPGFIEPLFFTALSPGGDEKGSQANIMAGLDYKLKDPDIDATLTLAQYEIWRNAPVSRLNDDIHLKLNEGLLSLNYPLSPTFAVIGGVSWMHYYGHTVSQLAQDFTQTAPMIGLSYNPDNRSTVQLSYRLFNYNNTADKTQNWSGSQAIVEFRTSF